MSIVPRWRFTDIYCNEISCLERKGLRLFRAGTFGLCGRILPLLLLEQAPEFVDGRLQVPAQRALLLLLIGAVDRSRVGGSGGDVQAAVGHRSVEAALFLSAVDFANVRGTDGRHLDEDGRKEGRKEAGHHMNFPQQ